MPEFIMVVVMLLKLVHHELYVLCCSIEKIFLPITGLESVRNRLEWDFLGKYMFCMLLQGSLLFLLTVGVQTKFWKRCLSAKTLQVDADDGDGDEDSEEDEDVLAERERVLNGEDGDDVLQLKNLFKRLAFLFCFQKNNFEF